jgi:WD40 repeat protein
MKQHSSALLYPVVCAAFALLSGGYVPLPDDPQPAGPAKPSNPALLQAKPAVPLPLGPLRVDCEGAFRLALSPDNRYLVWSKTVTLPGPRPGTSIDRTYTHVWSVAERREVASLPIEDGVIGLAFSPDGQLLASTSHFDPAQLWDTKTWKRHAVLDTQGEKKDDAWGVAFSRDGKSLAVGYYHDHTVRLWDVATRKMRILGRLPYTPEHLSFSAEDRYLAAADTDSNLKVWEVGSGKEHWSFEAHVHPISKRVGVQGVAFHPDGRTLVTAGTDGMVRLWDVPDKKELRHFEGKVGEIDEMALSPDGKLVAVTGRKVWHPEKPGGVRIFDVKTGRQVAARGPLENNVLSMCFARDSSALAVGTTGPKGQIFIWTVTDLLKEANKEDKP